MRSHRCPPFPLPALGLLLAAALLAGCPGAPAVSDAGPPPPPAAPPPPSPQQQLATLVNEGARQLEGATPEALLALDQRLYDGVRPLDPGAAEVKAASELRARIKAQLVPAYAQMAQASLAAHRYDEAARQAGNIPEDAPAALLALKRTILGRMPQVLAQRAACARTNSAKACHLCEEHPGWTMKICRGLTEEMVGLDMTPEMVRISWGEPLEIKQEPAKGGLQAQWFYKEGAFVTFTGASEAALKVSEVHN